MPCGGSKGGGSGGVLTPLLKIEFPKQQSKFLKPWYLVPTKSEPQTFHLFLAEETNTPFFSHANLSF